MEAFLEELFAEMNSVVLAGVIVVTIMVLGKSADWLVDAAVALSEKSRIPKVVIGATVVSLGTTAPEAAVSVLAAIQGNPGLALGNAVGSIICDTGLILGLASLIAPLKLNRRIVNRQGWIQLGAGFALAVFSLPFSNLGVAFTEGGNLPRVVGFVFLLALAVYIIVSVRWARASDDDWLPEDLEADLADSTTVVALKLAGSLMLVLAAATVLIPAVAEAARRFSVPDSVIAATLVAFGTSLPELVTAVKAAMRGHGELAVGNVIGADILNVLFVAGAAAAVTPGGLVADPHFFVVLFPAMLFILLVFRIGIIFSGDSLKRPFGVVLLAVYAFVTLVSYLISGPQA
jgi:cation:H+ antiporter